ncbi:MAG: hypothetical protein U0975_08520 [Erythrobacter sp.]|nr:hypothetical protein [Erythrobacter sp.]MDZ4135205.1 hypothetical protein [Paracoccaceae bacterium]MDZ4272700.1 hypothetical protein [Erythrobacter sp.]
MMTRIHRSQIGKGRPDGSPVQIDRDAIAWRLSNATYASEQARQLLTIIFDHREVTASDALRTLVVACLDYLEDGEDTINQIYPMMGVRSDDDQSPVRPA